MQRLEAIWLRILSIMLILLGAALFASPQIRYSTSEEIRNTPLSVKREKVITVPRPVAVIIVAAGVLAFLASRRSIKAEP